MFPPLHRILSRERDLLVKRDLSADEARELAALKAQLATIDGPATAAVRRLLFGVT